MLTNSKSKLYTDKLRQHYEEYFGIVGQRLNLRVGINNLIATLWIYCTVGMPVDRDDENFVGVEFTRNLLLH